jgi:hypothetical protein
MFARHEPPSPRRSSSSSPHLSSPPVTPVRPLSSSFYAPIDQLSLRRQETLSIYPQHIFPSELNKLDSSLETPYAFSYKEAAFYWTRDDALANRKLNIWAKPPCLNCELAGEGPARRCNRYTRQEDSLGKIQSCTRCERECGATSCVEQIEIRADGTYGHTDTGIDPDIDVEKDMPSEPRQPFVEEQNLRASGLVWWMPINLGHGNIEKKEALVARWKQQRQSQVAPPTMGNINSQSSRVDQIAMALIQERVLVGRARNQNLVAEWDENDLMLEPRLLALQAEGAEETTKKALKFTKSGDECQNSKLADKQLYWTNKIEEQTAKRYFKEAEVVGRDVEDALQTAEEALVRQCISQACGFLRLRQNLVDSGSSEEVAILSSKKALSEEVSDHLQSLVPQMFRTGF